MSDLNYQRSFKISPWMWWLPIVVLLITKLFFTPWMPWYIIFMPLAIQLTFLGGFMLLAYAFTGWVITKAIAQKKIIITKVEP